MAAIFRAGVQDASLTFRAVTTVQGGWPTVGAVYDQAPKDAGRPLQIATVRCDDNRSSRALIWDRPIRN